MKTRNVIGLIVRIFIGLVFMASAITKLLSIDAFDQFVYEHRLFSWTITTVVTRLLIACEFTLGLLLILGLYPKTIKTLIIIFLAGFSVYILLKPTLFDVSQENCHCFGTVLILNDTQTLIKNIVLLALSYFMFWNKGTLPTQQEDKVENKKSNNPFIWFKNNQRFSAIWLFAIVLILAFTIKMPDVLQYKLYGKTAKINKEKFTELINHESLQSLNITKGKKIVCMYSPICKYCRKSAMRLDVMREKYNIADENFALIFWGDEKLVEQFFIKTNTKKLPYVIVPPQPFLQATKRRQPLIVLVNDGKIEKVLKYPNIIDEDIYNFINK
ncbi:MAG: DoxX family membrane protein [Bacteroidales bacterium]|nr:DoxX family membrane protein [Bacteroidales bacterium]